jgi:hypothetical protein
MKNLQDSFAILQSVARAKGSKCVSQEMGTETDCSNGLRVKRRKTMTDRLILTILIAIACPLLLPIVIEEEAEEDNDQ